MENSALLSLFATVTCSMLLVAGCVLAFLRRDSASTRPKKPQDSQPTTEHSEIRSAIASLQVDQAELFSTLEKLTTTVKRLSSRAGMQDVRAREATTSTPEVGASKRDLLAHYGMLGKVGPEFAREQMRRERETKQ